MPVKRKRNFKSLCEKCPALINIESGLFNKEVAKKSLLLSLNPLFHSGLNIVLVLSHF